MNLLTELLGERLLQRTDRQAGGHQLLWLSYPTELRGSLFVDQRQTLDSEQSLGPDTRLAFWRISGLVLPSARALR